MPHNNGKEDSAEKWLDFAASDLTMASLSLPHGARYEQLCFFAQQATEKSLKALLLFLGINFPVTHNIQLLISLLPAEIQSLPVFSDADLLTPYAVLTRYPSAMEPVTAEQYADALQSATAVVNWINIYITTHKE